jgi:hypothetical protein
LGGCGERAQRQYQRGDPETGCFLLMVIGAVVLLMVTMAVWHFYLLSV